VDLASQFGAEQWKPSCRLGLNNVEIEGECRIVRTKLDSEMIAFAVPNALHMEVAKDAISEVRVRTTTDLGCQAIRGVIRFASLTGALSAPTLEARVDPIPLPLFGHHAMGFPARWLRQSPESANRVRLRSRGRRVLRVICHTSVPGKKTNHLSRECRAPSAMGGPHISDLAVFKTRSERSRFGGVGDETRLRIPTERTQAPIPR
jgi:hypothetical protein